jgi:N-carbamoylputrescine amidase
MTTTNVKIGLIQAKASPDKQENIDKAIINIKEAAAKGAKIICLQELFNTLYLAQEINIANFSLAEQIPGFTTHQLCPLAKKLRIYLIVPIFEVENRHFYNSAVVIDPEGEIIGKYRKNHIPQNAGYQEKYYFRPGNLGYPVFETPYCKFGISLCWDQWFVEPQRAYGKQGCHIVFSPTAVGFCNYTDVYIDNDYLEIWKTMFKGQCIQNGIYFAVANRVGRENNIEFYGQSAVYAPRGDVVEELGDEEDILIADIDLDKCREWIDHQQFWRDIR